MTLLDLSLSFDRPGFAIGDRTLPHLLLRLVPPVVPATVAPRLDLALVLDASGSMAGRPLAAARDAAAQLVQALPPSTRLSVLTFAEDVRVHVDACGLDERGRGEALANLATIAPRGSTDLGAGWLAGCAALATEARDGDGRQRHVLVLSDGRANRGIVDPRRLAWLARERLDQGISTTCVGFGEHYSPEQLSALAEHGGGSCHDTGDRDEIVEVLLGEALSLSAVAVADVRVTVETPYGIAARELSGLPHRIEHGCLELAVGALRGGIARTLVLRLERLASGMFARGPGEPITVTVRASWRGSDCGSREAIGPRHGTLHAADDRVPSPSAGDARLVLLAWQADLVRRATELDRRRDHAGLAQLWADDGAASTAYAGQRADTAEFVVAFERMRRSSGHGMAERSRKVALDLATKLARQARPQYRKDKGQVAAWFEAPPDARRGADDGH